MCASFEEQYKKESCYWGLTPHKAVIQILKYKTSGKVLDLGVGEGRNALFLAKKGFEVTGVDISQVGIDKFLKLAKTHRVKVKSILTDIAQLEFNSKWDIILSIATLHFLKKEMVYKVIQKMQNHTRKGGLNVITVFTKNNPIKNFPYLFEKGELSDIYKGWILLNYNEFITPFEKHGKDGEPHKHAVAVLIAKKA